MAQVNQTNMEFKPGEDDKDYQEAASSTADYANYEEPQKQRNPVWRKLGIGALIAVAFFILAGGAYWLINKSDSSKKTGQPAQAQNTVTSTSTITVATKHYDSANFNLGFDYPADWAVNDDTEKGILTVKSPAIALKDADSKDTNTQITMTIRPNTDKLAEFDSGNSVAAIASEKIAYTQPTQAQRANTYLSFLRYANVADGMNGVYITSDNGYKEAQAIPKVDVQKSEPVISVIFLNFDDKSGLGISTDSWDDPAFSEPIKNMLQSFTIN